MFKANMKPKPSRVRRESNARERTASTSYRYIVTVIYSSIYLTLTLFLRCLLFFFWAHARNPVEPLLAARVMPNHIRSVCVMMIMSELMEPYFRGIGWVNETLVGRVGWTMHLVLLALTQPAVSRRITLHFLSPKRNSMRFVKEGETRPVCTRYVRDGENSCVNIVSHRFV